MGDAPYCPGNYLSTTLLVETAEMKRSTEISSSDVCSDDNCRIEVVLPDVRVVTQKLWNIYVCL